GADAGPRQRARPQLKEPLRGQSRQQMLRDPAAKALPQAISTLHWRASAQIWPTPTCIRPTSAEVRFAARSAGARDTVEVVSDHETTKRDSPHATLIRAL